VTDNGVSAHSVFAVDAFAQKPFVEKIESLPVALHGTITSSQIREVSFTGKAGQEVICEVEAQRLESKFRPVLSLYGAHHHLLKWSLPQATLHGDTRIELKLPADGEYRLQLHDLEYAATPNSAFRLKIGQWSYTDMAFPPMVQRGQSAEVELVGHMGEARKSFLSSNAEGDAVPAPWADTSSANGPQVPVWLSNMPELVEQRQGSASQKLPPLPVAVSGRISRPGEEDLYELIVQPETEVEVAVTADVFGSPIDAELELRDAKGARLALGDDTPEGPDPRLSYRVPKGMTQVFAVVRDVNGRGGPTCIYRLHAEVKAAEKAGSFSLKMMEDSQTLSLGRSTVFKVEAERDGYEGPINLNFDSLPKGIKVSGQTIPAQATATLLSLTSDGPLPAALVSLRGRAQEREVAAEFDSAFLARFQPWLASELALAPAQKTTFDFSIDWGKGIDNRRVPLSGKLALPVCCSRVPGHDGPVRLTLLTSQARVHTKGSIAIDTNRTLREEKAILIEEDKAAQRAFDAVTAAKNTLAKAQAALSALKPEDQTADAARKAVETAQATLEVAEKAAVDANAKAKNDVDFSLLVPADLPEIPHQIAFKAELLKRDRRTVEAVAYTPVHEFPVVNPIAIKLTPPAPAKLDAKTGATLELTGEIERLEGAKGDVTLTLAGLPPGVTAPATATVKANETHFKFLLRFPAGFKAGQFSSLKVSGSGRPYGNTLVKTRDTEMAVTVLPADPPPPPQPKPAA
jgi:hypothetical protein